jgi:hypothetical protein
MSRVGFAFRAWISRQVFSILGCSNDGAGRNGGGLGQENKATAKTPRKLHFLSCAGLIVPLETASPKRTATNGSGAAQKRSLRCSLSSGSVIAEGTAFG